MNDDKPNLYLVLAADITAHSQSFHIRRTRNQNCTACTLSCALEGGKSGGIGVLASIPIFGIYWYMKGERIMAKNTSISLGDHFEGFINSQIESGRYESVSEVVRTGLRLLEEREKNMGALRHALMEGEKSGDAGALDMKAIKHKARTKAARRA